MILKTIVFLHFMKYTPYMTLSFEKATFNIIRLLEPVSFANMLNDNDNSNVNIHTMEADVPNEADFDVRILIASVKESAVYNAKPKFGVMGRSSYARVMIEIDAHKNMIDALVVDVLKINDTGYTCPKVTKEAPRNYVDTSNDGFQVAKKRGHNRQQHEKTMGLKTKSKLFIDMCLLSGSAFKRYVNEASKKPNEASTSVTSKYPNEVESTCSLEEDPKTKRPKYECLYLMEAELEENKE
ncbi:hypothetical protein Tco_0959534 [Tanacetum coccineum]